MVSFVDQILGFLFGWAINISPLFGIIVISFILSLVSLLAFKYLTDQELMKSFKERSKEMQNEIKKHKNDPKKMMEVNKKVQAEQMDLIIQQFKQSLKPMLVTLIPFILIFTWIRNIYEPFGTVFLGMGGIGNYIVFSLIFSLILRK